MKRILLLFLFILLFVPIVSATSINDTLYYYGMDEQTGTTIIDKVGTLNATAFNTPINWSGIIGFSYNYTGLGQRIISNNNIGISGANARTLSLWAYWNGTGEFVHFAGWGTGVTGQLFALATDDTGKLYFAGWGTADYNTGTTIPLNQWVHIAVTYDGARVNTYVNGTGTATTDQAKTLNTLNGRFFIGGRSDNSTASRFTGGAIDEVAVWNRALNSTEIAELNSVGLSGLQYPFTSPVETINITGVEITANTTSVLVDEVFSWNTSYLPANATNVSLLIDFDDAVTSTADSGTYSYDSVGLYNLSVNATDGQGNSVYDNIIINVSAVPEPEPTLKNITFGLYDNTNNVSLSGFFYDYNGTAYFSSGTGQTKELDYDVLYNVSFTKTGYDDVDYLNVNISEESQTTITGFTNPIPVEVVNMSNISFTAVNDANDSISGFSVSINEGVYFGTATGTELVLSIPENDTINQLFNLSYSKFGYYTSTYEDINLSTLAHEGTLVAKSYVGDESLDDKAVIWIIFALVAGIGVSAIFSKPMLIVFGFAVMFLTYFLGSNIMVSYYWFNPLGYILGAVIILTGMLRLGFDD